MAHGETGFTAHLLPFTVDGLIWAASMVALDASRRNQPVPCLALWRTAQCKELADAFRRLGLPASVRGAEYRLTLVTLFVEGCAAGAVLGRETSNYRLAALLGQWRSILGAQSERRADAALTALLLDYADKGAVPAGQFLGDLLSLGFKRAL